MNLKILYDGVFFISSFYGWKFRAVWIQDFRKKQERKATLFVIHLQTLFFLECDTSYSWENLYVLFPRCCWFISKPPLHVYLNKNYEKIFISYQEKYTLIEGPVIYVVCFVYKCCIYYYSSNSLASYLLEFGFYCEFSSHNFSNSHVRTN